MALLNRDPAKPRPVRALLVSAAAVLSVTACSLASLFGGGEKPFAFSHKVHVTDESLDCETCHAVRETDGMPGMPVLNQCMLCHEAIDAEKPPERKVASLFADGVYQAAWASRLDDEVVFSHKDHVGRGAECAECHRGIETNEIAGKELALDMDACMACHAAKSAPNDCAVCHREIRREAQPPSHAKHWLERHGKVVRAHDTATSSRCSLCHHESSCATCHRDVPPPNHTNYFRGRGHGFVARMDRENCSACHRSDSCDSCHRQTPPRSHVGTFGGARSDHCISCHFPLDSSNGCATCHKSAPSHANATPMPAWHNAGMNCRQCHGVTIKLPHADKGDNCTQCHH